MIDNNIISTTEKQIYIVELAEPFERLEVQFMPEDYNISRRANYGKVMVTGRNTPRYHFTGGEDALNMKLQFMAHSEVGDEVYKKINWLRSLTYSDSFSGPTRNVKIVFGALYRGVTWLITAVDAKPIRFDHRKQMYPIQAEVNISLVRDYKTNPTINQIRNE